FVTDEGLQCWSWWSGTQWSMISPGLMSGGGMPTTLLPNHAPTHKTGGTDVIASAVAAGNAGLMTGADKTKLDGVAPGANLYVHPNHSGDVTSAGDGAQTIKSSVSLTTPIIGAATGTSLAV